MRIQLLGAACVAAQLAIVAAAGSASADTYLIEAEEANSLTEPLLTKDAFAGTTTPASAGRYLEVQAGKNNNASNTTPTVDPITGEVPGQACYSLFFFQTGTYKIFGRVIAPTTADDSFWVRVDSGAWINWNTITLGSAWHWDSVHGNNSMTPLTFAFNEQSVHLLCVAYREDGAKLDALLVTSDSTINPLTATRPALAPQVGLVGGKSTILLEWTAVPGATSYAIKRSTSGMCFTDPTTFSTIKSGITNGLTFADTGRQLNTQYCYKVTATGGGASLESDVTSASVSTNFQLVNETDVFTLTTPLAFVDSLTKVNAATGVSERVEVEGLGSQPTVAKQLDATAIARGIARYDFQLPETMSLRLWGLVSFFDDASDSFWVRMDRGPWIKWNGWHVAAGNSCSRTVDPGGRLGGGWVPIYDGDNSNTAVKKVFTSLAAGTHSLELALREPAAGMDRIFIGSDLNAMPGGCFD
jgi:hypothetical protein